MLDIFVEKLGLEPWIASYVLLPVMIFMARILDVSIGTIRVVFIMQGNKRLAPLLGFLESFLWLVAVSQIIKNVDNFISYIGFAGGFATGTYVGLLIEEKLALGKVLIRVITKKEAFELIEFFKEQDFNFTNVPAEGRFGKVNVLFSVIKRDRLPVILAGIKQYNPNAFYTIESVKSAAENQFYEEKQRYALFSYLTAKRK
jgi:uncharacterized protein YebE (UPF0316 family)